MDKSEQQMYEISDSDEYESDDTQDDPNFDVLEETRSAFSILSTETNLSPRVAKAESEETTEETMVAPLQAQNLVEQDEQSYEKIQKLIQDGELKKLKVDECKIYLRKHGLRLGGNKETLIQRIKEHNDIINGSGEKRYPESSFVFNCKGDACMGDVVMFEQNVYEEFNIASRSGNGLCGTRIVAGRIVKESYGAAKQQHTFTIEVLWSKGEKPLPPLHPLLIKGRNLYRLKTTRQKWKDEGDREKILLEKHARGNAARFSRETRIQQRTMHKTQKLSGEMTRKEHQSKNRRTEKKPMDCDHHEQKAHCYSRTGELNVVGKPSIMPPEKLHHRQPFVVLNGNSLMVNRSHIVESSILWPNRTQNSEENRPKNHSIKHGNLNDVGYHPVQKQMCRYYMQGRCCFGDRCKYLHIESK